MLKPADAAGLVAYPLTTRVFTVPSTGDELTAVSWTGEKNGIPRQYAKIAGPDGNFFGGWDVDQNRLTQDELYQLAGLTNEAVTPEGTTLYADSMFDDGGDHEYHARRLSSGKTPDIEPDLIHDGIKYDWEVTKDTYHSSIQVAYYLSVDDPLSDDDLTTELIQLDIYEAGEWKRYKIVQEWAHWEDFKSTLDETLTAWYALKGEMAIGAVALGGLTTALTGVITSRYNAIPEALTGGLWKSN